MGAGDSFIAGFLYGILNGLNVQDSMEAGAQNSAVTIGYKGAWGKENVTTEKKNSGNFIDSYDGNGYCSMWKSK